MHRFVFCVSLLPESAAAQGRNEKMIFMYKAYIAGWGEARTDSSQDKSEG